VSAQVDTPSTLAARSRDENFSVASLLLPRATRERLLAVYAFARLTDQIGDEGDGDRLARLDWVESELTAAAAGTATHPVFVQLEPVLARLDCGPGPFRDLIEANRVDQRVHAYATFEALRGYCMLSAAPVGRIVLSIFGATTPERIAQSDDVCVALQLVEHLQDVGEDALRGRVYLPQEDLAAEGCDPSALVEPAASSALVRVIAGEVGRARALLTRGEPLAASLPVRPRVAVAGFVGGGRAALDAIDRAGSDVLAVACRPTRRGVAWHALRCLVAARRRGRR